MENLTEKDRIELLLKYREILANGRVKPDREGRLPYIRESLEGIGIMRKIDDILTEKLNLRYEEFQGVAGGQQ